MKAKELAEILLQVPSADVLVDCGDITVADGRMNSLPYSIEPSGVALNNEANAWILTPVPPKEKK